MREVKVSILTHRLGWVQHFHRAALGVNGAGFNPHPPPRVGATARRRASTSPFCGFNPHPPPRVGATCDGGRNDTRCLPVSILTHRLGWVQLAVGAAVFAATEVSILTHRLGWVQHAPIATMQPTTNVSILTHRLGWVQPSGALLLLCFGPSFNPHPPPRVGAT